MSITTGVSNQLCTVYVRDGKTPSVSNAADDQLPQTSNICSNKKVSVLLLSALQVMPQINQLKRQWQMTETIAHTGLRFRLSEENANTHIHAHTLQSRSHDDAQHLRNWAIILRFLREIAAVCWVTSHQSCWSQCSQNSQKQQTFWNSAVWYLLLLFFSSTGQTEDSVPNSSSCSSEWQHNYNPNPLLNPVVLLVQPPSCLILRNSFQQKRRVEGSRPAAAKWRRV